MEQLELFEYRRDCLFDSKNQIAHYFDILKETKDTISYAIAGMSYEEYVDIDKDKLNGLTYDQILNYLNNSKKEERLDKYKKLLKFRNIPFEADIFTWNDVD